MLERAELNSQATAQPSSDNRAAISLIAVCLTLLYASLISVQMGRHLWYDELLTLFIARESSFTGLLHLPAKWDLNPPLLHLLAHASLALARNNPLAIRIPSILEFYGASAFLFAYGMRKLGKTLAWVPVLLLWSSPAFYYATEARPYALLCFWFCALLLAYELATSGPRKPATILCVALAAAGLLNSHVLAVLSLLPFAVAEGVRYLRRRVPDFRLWIALLLPLTMVVFYLPLYRSYKAITFYPPAFQASWRALASFYWHTVVGVLLPLCLVVALVVSSRLRRLGSVSASKLSAAESALFATLTLVPVGLSVIMMFDHAPFWGRYCITTAVGIYFLLPRVIFSWAEPRRGSARLLVAGLCILLFGTKVLWPGWRAYRHPAPADASALIKIKPELPLVVSSGMTFVEMGQYERAPLLSRMYYLEDRASAIRFAHATMFEDLAGLQRQFGLPGQVEPYSKFLDQHRLFLVFGTRDYPEDWLLRRLAADRASITLLGTYSLPYKDKDLFLVQTPTEKAARASAGAP